MKQAQNQPKLLQTSPNYSPKFPIKLAVSQFFLWKMLGTRFGFVGTRFL